MSKKLIVLLFVSLIVTGCASVNIRTDNLPESQHPPTFEQSYVFWWWGIDGEHSVNVREVCLGKKVKQMQTVASFQNSVITILTLGIYSKRTARVWCED